MICYRLDWNVRHDAYSPLGVNAHGLPNNWFWRVGSVARKFYCLEANRNDSFLERSPTYQEKKKILIGSTQFFYLFLINNHFINQKREASMYRGSV